MTWQNLPIITCPHCGKEFQVDDYYGFEPGDSLKCPKCGKEIYIWMTDTTVSFDIHSDKE